MEAQQVGTAFFCLFVTCVVARGIYSEIDDRKRCRKVRGWAFANDFVPSRGADYSCLASELGRAERQVRFSYEGNYAGRRALIAEFRFGSGKSTYRQTFVAVERTGTSALAITPIGSALKVDYRSSKGWVIGTISRQRLGAEAIEGYLRCFA